MVARFPPRAACGKFRNKWNGGDFAGICRWRFFCGAHLALSLAGRAALPRRRGERVLLRVSLQSRHPAERQVSPTNYIPHIGLRRGSCFFPSSLLQGSSQFRQISSQIRCLPAEVCDDGFMQFKNASKKLLLMAIAAAFSGCTMIPQYQRPAVSVATSFPAVTTNNETHVAEIGWRDFVAEPRLQKLVELALTNNLDLRVAVLNVEQSRAQYRITRSASFPGIDGGGSFTRSHANDVTANQWSASIGTTAYEIDLFGRVRSLNRQALEKFFATDEARRAAQISLVAEIATEYFALRQAEQQLALARQTLQTVQGSYELNKASFDAGAVNELDLRTAEGQVETAKINVLTYERQRAQAENALTLLVGQPLPVELPAAKSLGGTNILAEIAPGLPSELVQRRADILEAEHTLKAANANIGAARAAFFPRITFTTSIGTTSSQLSELFQSGTGVWSFSPQVTLPIFTGGQTMADLDAAKISKRIEIANYQKAIQTAFREVADALVETSTYAQQIEDEERLVATQQRRFDLATLRYRQGEDSYLNVLSAQQDLYNAQQGLLSAQYNKLASQIALYQALGGGWK
jgi:multidrug efflux system outer membrane protein